MKVDVYDAHDRHQKFVSQDFGIDECCQNLIDQRPFGSHPFYIFAHARTDDDGVTKRLIWQPRLTKPKAQTNSMLFKAYPQTGEVQVIWIIPSRELWPQYNVRQVCHSPVVLESIDAFENRRHELEKADSDDLNDEQINAVYREISSEAKRQHGSPGFSYKHLKDV